MKSKILTISQWAVVVLAVVNMILYWSTPAVFGWIVAIPAWLSLALTRKDRDHGNS